MSRSESFASSVVARAPAISQSRMISTTSARPVCANNCRVANMEKFLLLLVALMNVAMAACGTVVLPARAVDRALGLLVPRGAAGSVLPSTSTSSTAAEMTETSTSAMCCSATSDHGTSPNRTNDGDPDRWLCDCRRAWFISICLPAPQLSMIATCAR